MIWLCLLLSITAIVVGATAVRRSRASMSSIWGVCLSALCLVPLAVLLLMRSAGASPVRQLNAASGESAEWWSLWVNVWPILTLGLMCGGLIATIGLIGAGLNAIRWREHRYHRVVVVQWLLVLAQLFAVFILIVGEYPDA